MLKITVETEESCPLNVIISVFVSMFHNLIVLSLDPLAKIYSFGLKATDCTASTWLERDAISVHFSAFQSFIVLSYDPLARIVPLLLKAIDLILY